MRSKFLLLFILLGIIILATGIFLLDRSKSQLLPNSSGNSNSQNTISPFTVNGHPVYNGYTFAFGDKNGGYFIATLEKVYEDKKDLYIDLSLFDDKHIAHTKKVLVYSSTDPNYVFAIEKRPKGEIHLGSSFKPLTISGTQAKKVLEQYIHQDVVAYMLSYLPSDHLPDTSPIAIAKKTCNIPFFSNIVNKDYNSLYCVPYVQYIIVH